MHTCDKMLINVMLFMYKFVMAHNSLCNCTTAHLNVQSWCCSFFPHTSAFLFLIHEQGSTLAGIKRAQRKGVVNTCIVLYHCRILFKTRDLGENKLWLVRCLSQLFHFLPVLGNDHGFILRHTGNRVIMILPMFTMSAFSVTMILG